ncbi:hypothetical protein NEOLI_005425 [Neolecta irregularis DAH-3]|uniref:Uncharacterized protein n=1 Tax=Neolecta irregularis (strain DAH-3) TaxID=1198029 RepID=A0A1U7LTK3_NEOID|nr:hypothetical protein NEOLI_005425 [Neolecta irregularis DAH-3]|eukprot:OLL25959.1 hypothetical protein NEOLI_005425 [Neolecta irregularis DAH-3]
MTITPYLTHLALGPDCFEETRSSDHPEIRQSKIREKAIVRAHNDILETLGLLDRIPKGRQTPSSSNNLEETAELENNMDLVMNLTSWISNFLLFWQLSSVRCKIQTFEDINPGMSYSDILKTVYVKGLPLTNRFTGLVAYGFFEAASFCSCGLEKQFISWVSTNRFLRNKTTRRPYSGIVFCARIVYSIGSWFILYPIRQHYFKQLLDLAPPYPFLPPLYTFIEVLDWPLFFATLAEDLIHTYIQEAMFMFFYEYFPIEDHMLSPFLANDKASLAAITLCLPFQRICLRMLARDNSRRPVWGIWELGNSRLGHKTMALEWFMESLVAQSLHLVGLGIHKSKGI